MDDQENGQTITGNYINLLKICNIKNPLFYLQYQIPLLT